MFILYYDIENKTNFIVTKYINKIKLHEIYNTREVKRRQK